ncbi:MAG: arginase family protein [Sphingobacteriales bacterium]|nr:MAG: arginase family protein [Sphingobacteriales bacterium]
MIGKPINIITAASILGLRPSGVEHLADTLLAAGLAEALNADSPIIQVPLLNGEYNSHRDKKTQCLNPQSIKEFSINLANIVVSTIEKGFPLVLGGDCSILLGIMCGLKGHSDYGLIFMDAHADFYQPEQSITGEVADMDLAIVTGRGPELLTNIHSRRPYVADNNVIHVGQRDWKETKHYGSQDIKETDIRCFDLRKIEEDGTEAIGDKVLRYMDGQSVNGYWIHFDTDVISDKENPSVDYRLPGGLTFAETSLLLQSLLASGKITGMSVSIFNPLLDPSGMVANNLVECIRNGFQYRA